MGTADMANVARISILNTHRALSSGLITSRLKSCIQSKTLTALSATNINQYTSVSAKREYSVLSAVTPTQLLVPSKTVPLKRNYGDEYPQNFAMVRDRVMLVLKLYDKINPEKLTHESHFINDLGLHSLDHVEIIMAMEDEFGFEIPDDFAEKLLTPGKIAQYVVESSQGGGVKPNLF